MSDNQGPTPPAIQRYYLADYCSLPDACRMEPLDDGGWVRWDDVAPLLLRLAELESSEAYRDQCAIERSER